MKDMSHFIISLIKSFLRIGGCISYIINEKVGYVVLAFLFAEILGIAEELMDKRG